MVSVSSRGDDGSLTGLGMGMMSALDTCAVVVVVVVVSVVSVVLAAALARVASLAELGADWSALAMVVVGKPLDDNVWTVVHLTGTCACDSETLVPIPHSLPFRPSCTLRPFVYDTRPGH
ncbi:hypothetical protein BCR44DRAFT_207771 [Catenaria anguillulae PL171]|uniref:Uncharacterized protein n=1 Tax=Catenaria anguillulae PL171 TaxID=765915 RepID=A0A1Y2HG04_9FUNG|nr:hypothetical protein BCR44DRAFT_207771 [Catenaria anguillulae PL171]